MGLYLHASNYWQFPKQGSKLEADTTVDYDALNSCLQAADKMEVI